MFWRISIFALLQLGCAAAGWRLLGPWGAAGGVAIAAWLAFGWESWRGLRVIRWLREDGADMVDASSAGNTADAEIAIGPSYQVWIAERLRREGLPVSAVGLITSAAQAESILATGQADVVSLGRPLLANPHLPITWAHELRAPSAAALIPPQYRRARFA